MTDGRAGKDPPAADSEESSAPALPVTDAKGLGFFGRIWRALGGRGPESRGALKVATFRLQYERFREILGLNDTVLELIADIEDMLPGSDETNFSELALRLRRATMDVFVMVKNLNLIAGDRHARLYDALRRINADIEAELPPTGDSGAVPLVQPLHQLRYADLSSAGGKMVRLAEVVRCGEPVAEGFVVTTAGFTLFMDHAGLWSELEQLGSAVRSGDEAALESACQQLQSAIVAAELPAALAEAMFAAFDALAAERADDSLRLAVRSSAIGEDEAASHAGQYHSELSVPRDALLAAYRKVIASAFGPAPIGYRLGQGYPAGRTLMAVGCLRMVDARHSGVMFTRHFARPDADELVLSATAGLAQDLVAGTESGREIVVDARGAVHSGTAGPLQSELGRLAALGRRLEAHFAQPLDIEWAIDAQGTLVVLQARPMRAVPRLEADAVVTGDGLAPIVAGGHIACPGAASGIVLRVDSESELARVPDGAVLVARHSAPWFSRVMPRVAALVTEIGSPVGHMAIIARELELPCIVGMRGALAAMRTGATVTVDASGCRVFAGALPLPPRPSRRSARTGRSPEQERLLAIGARVTPLHLTNPSGSEFTPEGCQSLHDITRYVHEKVFGVMFHFGDIAESDQDNAVRFDAALPFKVLLYDVGGGLAPDLKPPAAVTPAQVRSIPLQAFAEGLLDPRIVWNQPRPISGRGFLSVVGESMAGPPPDVQRIGRMSYAVISDRYLNFSTKAGYHFSTVDTYCGASLNKNYIHFRFAGGATRVERRARRVRFLHQVLEALEFDCRVRGDVLVARLQKYDRPAIELRLRALGRLTIVTRQLDMLMDSEASPAFFAQAFLEDRLESF